MARIILTGSQGTGKTTVLNMFKTAGYPVITEVVRNLHKNKGIAINEQGNEISQDMIWNEYKRLLGESSDYVSDRGLTDVLAYSMAGYQRGRVPEHTLMVEYCDLVDFVKDNPDIKWIYFPIEFAVVNDGVRSTNEDYRQEVNLNIKTLLDNAEIQYLMVHGTPQERFEQICEYIGDPKLSYNKE